MEKSRTEIESAINEWVMGEMPREMLKRKLIDGKCYEKIAEEFDVSQKTVQRIMNKWRGVVEKHI